MSTTKQVVPSMALRLFGRDEILSSVDEITEENVVEVLHSSLPAFHRNKAEIEYLWDVYRGKQDVLQRVKVNYPEICNYVVENHAKEIVDFKTGYNYSSPIQYVRRGKFTSGSETEPEANLISEKIGMLNEWCFADDKEVCDQNLGMWQFVCGTSYRFVYASKSDEDQPFKFVSVDPREAFIIYHSGARRSGLGGVEVINNGYGKPKSYVVWTDKYYFLIRGRELIEVASHTYGEIPIIEYPAHPARLGAFEPVLGLLNALNTTASNRVDAVEQFVQHYLVFQNCDVDGEELEKMKKMGAIKVASSDAGREAKVYAIVMELLQNDVQTLSDDLYQKMLIICGMPDRQGGSRSTGDTQQAVHLRDGWEAAENHAKMTEVMFKKSEKRFLKVVLKILADIKGFDLKLSDIRIKFTRNRTDNLLTKTQGMMNQLHSGIHPKVVIDESQLYSDPEQVYLDSLPILERLWINPPSENEEQSLDGYQPRGTGEEQGERTSDDQTQNARERNYQNAKEIINR